MFLKMFFESVISNSNLDKATVIQETEYSCFVKHEIDVVSISFLNLSAIFLQNVFQDVNVMNGNMTNPSTIVRVFTSVRHLRVSLLLRTTTTRVCTPYLRRQ